VSSQTNQYELVYHHSSSKSVHGDRDLTYNYSINICFQSILTRDCCVIVLLSTQLFIILVFRQPPFDTLAAAGYICILIADTTIVMLSFLLRPKKESKRLLM